jgi:hypothetical protein
MRRPDYRIRIIGIAASLTLRQLLRCPAMCRIVVHRLDRRAYLFISQGEESFNATYQP